MLISEDWVFTVEIITHNYFDANIMVIFESCKYSKGFCHRETGEKGYGLLFTMDNGESVAGFPATDFF